MKIGILGTRGIPNQYGGFERFAEYLSLGLQKKEHEVFVYCPSHQVYQSGAWHGVNLIYCYDAEPLLGTAGQFIYDFNCIMDSRKRDFDVLLLLGYTSSSIWNRLLPKQTLIISNMDGFEWKRSKYHSVVKKFLKKAEYWAVKSSDILVADAPAIQTYYQQKYNRSAHYIPYAADVVKDFDKRELNIFGVREYSYDLVIARMEPENHIEMIIEGFLEGKTNTQLVIIGKTENSYGRRLRKLYGNDSIRFVGGVYDQNKLNSLRYYSRLYFHGHSVGGTNPSLLEAMAARALIVAHDNAFNRYVLKQNAFYFSTSSDIANHVSQIDKQQFDHFINRNLARIKNKYTIQRIVDDYEQIMINYT